jgi:L-seryl-tRNA(Ser) seleniumtransferase
MTAPDWPPERAAEARKLPKTDRLLQAADQAGLVATLGHPAVVEAVRQTLDRIRGEILAGAPCPTSAAIEAELLGRLRGDAAGSLRPVVNATGVVIHTNLGRAPLSSGAIAAMGEVARGYASLEFDLEGGERGDRYDHAAAALCRLTGAEAAVVVNNNAAAVLLALAVLNEAPSPSPLPQRTGGEGSAGTPSPGSRPQGTGGGGSATSPLSPAPAGERRGEGGAIPEVIVSRGQLVEIGGGFRIPDVLRRSGAALVEVGTTNRTYAKDYEAAIGPATRILLSVHRSNFRISGFVAEASLEELAALGRRRGLWVVEDLGSGALLPTEPFGLGHEPTVAERVRAGADVVCFSGDKLLGGPQAGILVGRRAAIDRIRRHPLLRALRVDKVTLAGLAATLAHYERGEATREVPVWRAIATPPAALAARAAEWLAALRDVAPGAALVEGRSAIGGGTLPDVTLPTTLLALPAGDVEGLLARLRGGAPPVIARIEEGRVVLDPRTVLPGEDETLLRRIREALASPRQGA